MNLCNKLDSSKTMFCLLKVYYSVFQPFSSRGTSLNILSFDKTQIFKILYFLRIFRVPCKEMAEPLGSAELRLKNSV